MFNMMDLNCDLCACCGKTIALNKVVCDGCRNNPDTDFQIKKKHTLERLYGYDITEWSGIEVSPGYSEEEGQEALKDLLLEIREKSNESRVANVLT